MVEKHSDNINMTKLCSYCDRIIPLAVPEVGDESFLVD